MIENKIHYSVGRRKSSIARISLSSGDGEIQINNKPISIYNTYYIDQNQILIPLVITGLLKSINCNIIVQGGGRSGQVGAIQLGIARAICLYNPSKRALLKREGLLSRDARIKERRKYGLKKARKASQYSKR